MKTEFLKWVALGLAIGAVGWIGSADKSNVDSLPLVELQYVSRPQSAAAIVSNAPRDTAPPNSTTRRVWPMIPPKVDKLSDSHQVRRLPKPQPQPKNSEYTKLQAGFRQLSGLQNPAAAEILHQATPQINSPQINSPQIAPPNDIGNDIGQVTYLESVQRTLHYDLDRPISTTVNKLSEDEPSIFELVEDASTSNNELSESDREELEHERSQSSDRVPSVGPPPIRSPQEFDTTDQLLNLIGSSRLTSAAHEIRWSLNDAIVAALAHSNQVTSLQIESVEQLQNVGVEVGRFDAAGFIDQSFRDSSEPVGTDIETANGGQSIIQGTDLNVAYGVRKSLQSGGQLELSQSFQLRDDDSGILNPRDQGISRFNGRITKELLRGSGRSIAMNQVLVAQHNASAQRFESTAEIANHLNQVMTAYWDIFAARGALLAAIESRDLAKEVLRELDARQDIDAEQNLRDQTMATIGQRQLEIINARRDLAQAQVQLIALVNAPELLQNTQNIEFLPQVDAYLDLQSLEIQSRITTAIQRRPEIKDALAQISAAQTTHHLSQNELLPRLSLSLEAGLNGLEGERRLGTAFGNQFENDVTYQAGFNFEVPFANRQARFNRKRTELVISRLKADWQAVIEQVKADVLTTAESFLASQLRLQAQREVLQYSGRELYYLQVRKTIAPKEESNPSFALTQLLAAQERRGTARAQVIGAIADKHRAVFELNRATGILINDNVIPGDGGPIRPDCFAVYHQFVEKACVFQPAVDSVVQQVQEKARLN